MSLGVAKPLPKRLLKSHCDAYGDCVSAVLLINYESVSEPCRRSEWFKFQSVVSFNKSVSL